MNKKTFLVVLFFLTGTPCSLRSAAMAADAPSSLSKTGLYSDIAAKKIRSENRAYDPQYPLWSDGAEKSRWAFIPKGTKINTGKPGVATSPHKGNMDYWIFPVGTKFWKEFSFAAPSGSGMHRVETRYMEKIAETSWLFATYLWNDDETEASLAPHAGVADYYPINTAIKHDIPAIDACVTCHNRGGDMALGFDALQLSDDRDPHAPHGHVLPPQALTLKALIESAALTNGPDSLIQAPPIVRSKTELGRAAMGYLHANCGNCHNPTGTAGFSFLSFRYPVDTASEDASPAFVSAINKAAHKVLVPGQKITYVIKPGDPDASALIYAMKGLGQYRMPPIGSKIPDAEAIALLSDWIRSLSAN